MQRTGETVAIADRYFSPHEVRALRALPPDRQRERFFEYWTLKESYIKARGMGLAIPLHQFSFHLDRGTPVTISFDRELEDDPRAWQFDRYRPSERHLMASAIRRGVGPELRVELSETVPLR
jgi:4'-phosphopantetheinyl transferase